MTDKEKLSCLIDRPCTACKFHNEDGCVKWSCVFDQKSESPEGEYIKKEDVLFKKWQFKFKNVDGEHWFVNVKDIESLPTYSFPEREKGEWIPVSERLPEDMGDYIIDYTNEFGEFVGISHYDKYGFWSSSNVIAWQPLPEPYKAESEVKPNE